MNVAAYMAITPNGMVAKDATRMGFGSELDYNLFKNKVEETGNVIMGRNTFEASRRAGNFPHKAFNVVMTKKSIKNRFGKNVVFTKEKPEGVLRLLQSKGFENVLIAGGEKLVSSFVKEKLVDEIMLDFEPSLFTKGIRFFESAANSEARLKLLEVKRLSPNEVQLHYRVLK